MQGDIVEIKTKGLTFFVRANKIVACTRLQAFLLEADNYYWHKRLNNLRAVILLGDIETIEQLQEWCCVRNNNNEPIGQCIKLIPYARRNI